MRVEHDLPRWEDLTGVNETICDGILFTLEDVIDVNVNGQRGGSKCIIKEIRQYPTPDKTLVFLRVL